MIIFTALFYNITSHSYIPFVIESSCFPYLYIAYVSTINHQGQLLHSLHTSGSYLSFVYHIIFVYNHGQLCSPLHVIISASIIIGSFLPIQCGNVALCSHKYTKHTLRVPAKLVPIFVDLFRPTPQIYPELKLWMPLYAILLTLHILSGHDLCALMRCHS